MIVGIAYHKRRVTGQGNGLVVGIRLVIRPKQCEYAELNKQLHAWCNLAVSKNVYPVCGPQMAV